MKKEENNNNIITESTVIKQPSEQEIKDFLDVDALQAVEDTHLELMTDEEIKQYLTSDNKE